MFESAVPSFALNVNESGPLKFGSGVYVRLAPEPESEPWAGWSTIE